MTGKYRKYNLEDINEAQWTAYYNCRLFDQTWSWLKATKRFMVNKDDRVWIHSIAENDRMLAAWPLIHKPFHSISGRWICSMTSFYSALSEPYIANDQNGKILEDLLACIISNNACDVLSIGPVADAGASLDAVKTSGWPFRTYFRFENWYVDGIGGFNQYYKSRPSRVTNTIKRKQKKLDREKKWKISIYDGSKDFDEVMSDYHSVYVRSWKKNETSKDLINEVCRSAARQNKLRMGMLYLDDEPVAAQLWFLQNGTASIFKLAYDSDVREYSVGSVLTKHMMEYVIERDKVGVIEYGMGSEPYKKDWMTKVQRRIGIICFNPGSFRGNMYRARYKMAGIGKRILKRR